MTPRSMPATRSLNSESKVEPRLFCEQEIVAHKSIVWRHKVLFWAIQLVGYVGLESRSSVRRHNFWFWIYSKCHYDLVPDNHQEAIVAYPVLPSPDSGRSPGSCVIDKKIISFGVSGFLKLHLSITTAKAITSAKSSSAWLFTESVKEGHFTPNWRAGSNHWHIYEQYDITKCYLENSSRPTTGPKVYAEWMSTRFWLSKFRTHFLKCHYDLNQGNNLLSGSTSMLLIAH